MPNPDFISPVRQSIITTTVEPVHNTFTSLYAIAMANEASGFSDWINQTAAAMSREEMFLHRVVMIGLHYAVEPRRSYHDFESYLEELHAREPEEFRDRVLERYVSEQFSEPEVDISHTPEPLALLDNMEDFLNYLQMRLPSHPIDVKVESEGYRLLLDPPHLKEVVVTHLERLWKTTMRAEWERVKPIVQESADAFKQVDFSVMSKMDAYRLVFDDEPCSKSQYCMDTNKKLVFSPAAHIGPYKYWFLGEDTVWCVFGARLPEGVHTGSPDLSINEILVRLNALADETRLRILTLVAERGELCTSAIMEELDLTQSTAQRHLTQLAAAGYLNSQRKEGAKCFRLNARRFNSTFEAVKRLVQL
jgi:DNA-binding transcriptional ArsR family regulator